MATFATVQPVEGESGVTLVTVSTPEYTGRNTRTDTVAFTTSTGKSATVTVTQQGKEVSFVTSGYDGSVYIGYRVLSANGGNGYIDITTNSRQFYFGYGTNGTYVPIQITGATVTSPAAGAATVEAGYPSGDYSRYHSWVLITATGDPGKDNQYRIRIYLTVPANNTQQSKSLDLIIYDHDNYQYSWSEQATQPAAISTGVSSVNHESEGDDSTFTVTSQEHWDASVND